MKVEILDYQIFDTLDPTDVEKYLSGNNWQELRRISGEVSIWETSAQSGKRHRLWLPQDRELGDFAASMGRVIKAIALAENRSQLQVLEDLETVTIGDIIRVGSQDEFNRASGSLPLNDGILLIKQAQGMASASACSVVEKREVHPSRRPNRVIEYMKNIRLGQTERGSYLIKLISPISPPETKQIPLPTISTVDQVPFERQVVINLMKSLDALQMIAQETHRRGRFYFKPFQEIVSEGVSANLCESVASESERERYRSVEVSVTWSYVVDSPTERFKDIRFPTYVMPYIAEAARQFREQNPEEITLRGYVTSLRRSEMGEPGTVTVVGIVDEHPHSVRTTLIGETYDTAIHAHENGLEVCVDGRLTRKGNLYILEDPMNFHIVHSQQLSF